MSQFVQWLKAEWEGLEKRTGQRYSARKLSIEAGLSPNTLYQILKKPSVQPSPETCRKLAFYFGISPLMVLEMAGHVPIQQANEPTLAVEWALYRKDLQKLILSLKDLSPGDIQMIQRWVDQFRFRQYENNVASGAAVVLIIEDTPSTRTLLANMLQAAGLKVLEASDGRTALEIIKLNGKLIDMVITDYDMPHMNGVEVTKAIRKLMPNLPILFITGWTEPEIKYAALEAGASAYLVSPVDYDELIEVISQIRRERDS